MPHRLPMEKTMASTLRVTHHTARLNGITQHWVIAGDGPPVYLLHGFSETWFAWRKQIPVLAERYTVIAPDLPGYGPPVYLLHGFPETWYAWRKQIPVLAERYTVIAPDLRGYGGTEKPACGYDKRTMANDLAALMDHLGHERAPIIVHDRGARVGTRFAKDHRERIDRFVAMDNVPTRILMENPARAGQTGWFVAFLGVPDLPEALLAGRAGGWLAALCRSWSYNPDMLSPEEIGVYVRAYQQPGAVRGSAMDYRAVGEDVKQDIADSAEQ